MGWTVKDRPGVIRVAAMREYFERAMKSTPQFKGIPLDAVEEGDGHLVHYTDKRTDDLWLGFALGMRCAERIRRAVKRSGISPKNPTFYFFLL
jgi:hypothetical protein